MRTHPPRMSNLSIAFGNNLSFILDHNWASDLGPFYQPEDFN